MTHRRLAVAAFLTFLSMSCFSVAMAHDNGTHRIESKNSPADTMNKLEAMVKEKGFHVFARIDHAAGAKSIDKDLRPTELLIFGNPKGGTVLMSCDQQIGLDLPLKFLVWQDEQGKTWISYNEMEHFAKRYGLKGCGAPVVKNVENILELMATVASK
ncbi:MAG: DUF302 domain-containing protein [Gammaproteobacteria bacterium]|nr:DUF302 domain-containing protein [Gammaproteobacteria bacterium]